MEKTMEIPFGAKDSKLNGWEYTIPEGMEAEIKDGKIIVREKESEDEKIRKELIQYLKDYPNLPNGIYCRDDFFAWLEKQGSQNLANSEKTCKVEQNPAWSGEDEDMVDNIFKAIQHLLKENDSWGFLEDCLEWLKSLKERCTWKPSDEQMDALKEACDKHWEPDGLDPLYALYQDLKNLKG